MAWQGNRRHTQANLSAAALRMYACMHVCMCVLQSKGALLQPWPQPQACQSVCESVHVLSRELLGGLMTHRASRRSEMRMPGAQVTSGIKVALNPRAQPTCMGMHGASWPCMAHHRHACVACVSRFPRACARAHAQMAITQHAQRTCLPAHTGL